MSKAAFLRFMSCIAIARRYIICRVHLDTQHEVGWRSLPNGNGNPMDDAKCILRCVT